MKTPIAGVLGLATVATIAVMWLPEKWATTIPEVLALYAGRVVAACIAGGKLRSQWHWVIAPLAAVVALAGVQILTGGTVYAWLTRMAALYWAGNLATFLVASHLFEDRSWRVRYLQFAADLCHSSVRSGNRPIADLHVYDLLEVRRTIVPSPMGPFLYANQYAAFIELVLPLAIFGALTNEKRRILYSLAAALMFGSVLYSGSRGGSVLVGAELVLVPLLTSRKVGVSKTQMLNTGAILLVAFLWVAVAAGPDALVTKLSGQADPFAGRREFNLSSLQMIQARPLHGFGLWTGLRHTLGTRCSMMDCTRIRPTTTGCSGPWKVEFRC